MDAKDQDRQDPLIGATIDGRFVIQRVIGQGGMGTVYEALHKGLSTSVAIKVLNNKFSRKETSVKRFHSEARIASALKHPNLVTMQAFGVLEGNTPYMVMELIEGESLSDHLKHKGQLDKESFLEIFQQCCAGLSVAHEQGIVHRDIKPSNVMLVRQEGGQLQVKVTDFGIAKWEDSPSTSQNLTRTGEVLGTPVYMSPEQCEAKAVDTRSDIYSLGCVMYECLVGKPPFQSDTPYEIMMSHVNAEPESPTEKNVHLRKIRPLVDAVMHTLQKLPEKRPQTMDALRNELIDAGKGISNFKRKRVLRLSKMRWQLVAGLLAIILVVTVALAASHRNNASIEPEARLVDDRDPQSVYAEAERLRTLGDTETSALRYAQFLRLSFGPPTKNGYWIAKPGCLAEPYMRQMLTAAKGADAGKMLDGWPSREPWHQIRNAGEKIYELTKEVPPYIVQAFDDKARWTEERAAAEKVHSAKTASSFELVAGLENSLANTYAAFRTKHFDNNELAEQYRQSAIKHYERAWDMAHKGYAINARSVPGISSYPLALARAKAVGSAAEAEQCVALLNEAFKLDEFKGVLEMVSGYNELAKCQRVLGHKAQALKAAREGYKIADGIIKSGSYDGEPLSEGAMREAKSLHKELALWISELNH